MISCFVSSPIMAVILLSFLQPGLSLCRRLLVQPELEQREDKPPLYAVLGVRVDMTVFKGGILYLPAVMPQNFVHGFRVAAGRLYDCFIRYKFSIPHAKIPPFLPATSAKHCVNGGSWYSVRVCTFSPFPAVYSSRKSKGK